MAFPDTMRQTASFTVGTFEYLSVSIYARGKLTIWSKECDVWIKLLSGNLDLIYFVNIFEKAS